MVKKIKFNKITAFVLALLLFGMLFVPVFMINASAEDIEYSSVLTDLNKDPSFDETLYPEFDLSEISERNSDTDKENNISLISLICISESENSELFLYTYEPCDCGFSVLTVNLSYGFCQNDDDLEYSLFGLSLVSQEGPFRKYLVQDFDVPQEAERYYNIVAFYRSFIDGYDMLSLNGKKLDQAEAVNEQWCAFYDDNSLIHYEMSRFESVSFDSVYSGYISLKDGFYWGSFFNLTGSRDLWFYAFSSKNYNIKSVVDADLTYYKQKFTKLSGFDKDGDEQFDDDEFWQFGVGENEKINKTVSKDVIIKSVARGLGGKTVECPEIMTSSDFLLSLSFQGVKFNETVQQLLASEFDFVFVFDLTERNFPATHYRITDISTLRLKFIDVNDDVYNLGVVSDSSTPDLSPDGVANTKFDDFKAQIEEFLEKAVIVVGAIALICVLSFISPLMTVVKFIWNIIVHIFLLIWSILTLPFKILFRQRE